MGQLPNSEQLIENARFRVLGHLAAIACGAMMMTVIAPLLTWNIYTTYDMKVTNAAQTERVEGRMNAFSERVTNLQNTDLALQNMDTRIFDRIGKMDDRVRVLEIGKAFGVPQ